jgi:hypothetical protein
VKVLEELADGGISMPENSRCHTDTEDYALLIDDGGSLAADIADDGNSGDASGAGQGGCSLRAFGPDNVWDGHS